MDLARGIVRGNDLVVDVLQTAGRGWSTIEGAPVLYARTATNASTATFGVRGLVTAFFFLRPVQTPRQRPVLYARTATGAGGRHWRMRGCGQNAGTPNRASDTHMSLTRECHYCGELLVRRGPAQFTLIECAKRLAVHFLFFFGNVSLPSPSHQ